MYELIPDIEDKREKVTVKDSKDDDDSFDEVIETEDYKLEVEMDG